MAINRACLPVGALALLAACGRGEPATVAGDAFLAEGLGSEINLAGMPVRLLPDEAELDSALARLCPRGGAPEQRSRAWAQRNQVLGSRTLQTTVTDPEAQFVFDSVPGGRFRLWADTTVEGKRWTWLHRIQARGGDTLRADLSNANSDEDPFRCQR